MKKFILGLALAAAVIPATAVTFWHNGVLMGTVCRNGPFFTVYPFHMAQPVGTSCPIRDGFGNIVGVGVVTAE
jgi:hypothetical protein